MAKKKVFELAEEFKMSSAAMVQMLKGMGIPVKGHMSTVDEELRAQIKDKFEQERAQIKKEYERKREKLLKAREEMEGSPPPPPPVEKVKTPEVAKPTASASAQATGQKQHGAKSGGGKQPGGQQMSSRSDKQDSSSQQKPKSSLRKYHQKESWAKGGGAQQGGGQASGGGGRERDRDGGKPSGEGGQGRGQGQGRGGQGGGQGRGGDSRGGHGGGQGRGGDGRGGHGGGQGRGGDGRGGHGGGQGRGGDSRGGHGGGQGRGGDSRGGHGGGQGRGGDSRGGHGGGQGRGSAHPGVSQTQPPPKPDSDNKKAQGGKDKHKKKSGKHRNERAEINEIELKANVKKTLAKIGSGFTKKKYKKDADDQRDDAEDTSKMILKVAEFVTANELANMMNVPGASVITKCLEMGAFVTINQRLDFEMIELVADEFGYTAQLMEEYAPEEAFDTGGEAVGTPLPRAPVVTVMGHVDHGKTSLLDYIRKTNVIAGESGGITQHIAAYEVKTPHGPVTFLDTPGHEAFTAMRARGSQITDVIVLVIAADSAVMPQTREAIDHAKAADVPIVVAINKVDLPTANPEKIKGELASYNVLVEEYGGQVSCVEISAKHGTGVEKLLEILALETDVLELKATPEGRAQGVVIESELDKGKGPIATVLIQHGTLSKGDAFVTGIHSGRVRELHNERGAIVEKAGPSQPVLIIGMSGTPQAGDSFRVLDDEKEAREISARRRLAQKEREMRRINSVSLDNLYEQIKAGSVQRLNLIIKGDVDGSVEALATSLEKLTTPEIKVCVIHKSVGAIKETDIMLAVASNALIIGFHLSPNTKIRDLAKQEGVEIRNYRIIYEAVDSVHNAMEGMLKPEIRENILAEIVVRKVFKVSKIGNIAGCFVESGTINRNSRVRVIRNDVELVESKIASLKRIQDDVREVQTGYECGIVLERFSDFEENDRIVAFEEVEVARKLTKNSETR